MEFWFGPNIGSEDFVELFRRRGAWEPARRVMDVMQFYAQNVTPESHPVIGPNTVEAFVDRSAFRFLKREGIQVAVEGGLFKERQDTARNFDRLLKARRTIIDEGGDFRGWCLDEPLRAGEQEGESPDVAERDTLRYVPALAGLADVILIEPYPFFELDAWKSRILPLAAESRCVGIHVDVDAFHAKQRDGEWWSDRVIHDVQNICDVAHDEFDLTAGVIITGNAAVDGWQDGGVTSSEYCAAARRAAQAYGSRMNLTNADRAVVQSWHRNGEKTDVPVNLPDHVDLFGYVYGEMA